MGLRKQGLFNDAVENAVRFIGDSQQGVFDEDTGKWIKAEVFA